MVFWAILDIFFNSINIFFTKVFSYIPASAIQFLIAILCYSFLAFLLWSIDKTGATRNRFLLKILYRTVYIVIILFAIWRLGIIGQLGNEITIMTVSQFFINIGYIIIGLILAISFLKKITWLKKLLLIFLWVMFTLLTFIIGPITGEIELQFETTVSYLLVVALFLTPNIMNEYRKQKRSGKL